MLVKTFEGEDMASTLKQVKEQLGPHALILSTRRVRKGKKGLPGKSLTEITAAIDHEAADREKDVHTRNSTFRQGVDGYNRSRNSNNSSNFHEELNYETLWRRDAAPAPSHRNEPADTAGETELTFLKSEIHDLKKLLKQFLPEASTQTRMRGGTTRTRNTPAEEPFLDRLAELGIRGKTAQVLDGLAKEHAGGDTDRDKDSVDRWLRESLSGMLRITPPLVRRNGGRRIAALVGPTGVGKTTTIAKLAASYLADHGRGIALVTIDTYRIAAVEQLKVYGEIMNLPVEVVMSPSELTAVLDRHRDKDLILIDTAGRSPRDEISLAELAGFLPPDSGLETHLVLASPTEEQNLLATVDRFSHLRPESLIFTKVDECDRLGALANVLFESDIPLTYLTDGQKVPEDLIPATARTVAELIIAD